MSGCFDEYLDKYDIDWDNYLEYGIVFEALKDYIERYDLVKIYRK